MTSSCLYTAIYTYGVNDGFSSSEFVHVVYTMYMYVYVHVHVHVYTVLLHVCKGK